MRARFVLTGLMCAVAVLYRPWPANAQTGAPLVVALRPSITVEEPLARISTVATVRGGTAQLRQQIATLDLAELRDGEGSLTITAEQVSYRLQIAGIDTRLFRVEGRCVLGRKVGAEWSEASVLATATEAVRRRLPESATGADIALAQPVRLPPLHLQPGDRLQLLAELPAGLQPLGQVAVPIAVWLNGERKAAVSVFLNVSYLSQASATSPKKEDSPILVQQRDMVRLIAQIGAMRITALGEALQEGRAGQSIRVRNVDSNKVVFGRVVERQVVEVEY